MCHDLSVGNWLYQSVRTHKESRAFCFEEISVVDGDVTVEVRFIGSWKGSETGITHLFDVQLAECEMN